MRTRLLSLLGAVALLGCGSTGPDRRDGFPPSQTFAYPASVVVTGFQAPAADQSGNTAVGVRFTNAGTAPATIEHGACAVAVWLYRDDVRGSPPVWQNGVGTSMACIGILYTRTLARGESYDVAGASLGATTLGTTLPAGRYLVSIAMRRHDAGSASSGELIVLDAGAIVLAP